MRRGITHTGLDRRNVLALGHLINHRADQPSVRMMFVPLPEDYPPDLLMLAPNVNARPDKTRRWIIAAVAIREIHESEGELFLDYGRCPKSVGWQVDFLDGLPSGPGSLRSPCLSHRCCLQCAYFMSMHPCVQDLVCCDVVARLPVCEIRFLAPRAFEPGVRLSVSLDV